MEHISQPSTAGSGDTHMAFGLRLMSVLPHDLLERHSLQSECLSKGLPWRGKERQRVHTEVIHIAMDTLSVWGTLQCVLQAGVSTVHEGLVQCKRVFCIVSYM